ncbi:MAG: hypothetical protein IPM57_07385 [Oligoflexia bacterium]|nr:hypothetical protein [Oligoflexia bacterium]
MKFSFLLLLTLFATAQDVPVTSQAREKFTDCLVQKIRAEKRPIEESLSQCSEELSKSLKFKNIKPVYRTSFSDERTASFFIKTKLIVKEGKSEKVTEESSEVQSVFNISPDDNFCNNCKSTYHGGAFAALKEVKELLESLTDDSNCPPLKPGQWRAFFSCEARCGAGYDKVGEDCISKCSINETFVNNKCMSCEELKSRKYGQNYHQAPPYKVIAKPDERGICVDQFGCVMETQVWSFRYSQCVDLCDIGKENDFESDDMFACKDKDNHCDVVRDFYLNAPFNSPPQEVLNLVAGCDVNNILYKFRNEYFKKIQLRYERCLKGFDFVGPTSMDAHYLFKLCNTGGQADVGPNWLYPNTYYVD